MIMCNGSIKKKEKKREFAKWPPMKPPRNISNSLKCFVQLKKSSRSEFHKRFNEVFLSFLFLRNLSIGKKVRSKYIKT